jgi:hypothetical protein
MNWRIVPDSSASRKPFQGKISQKHIRPNLGNGDIPLWYFSDIFRNKNLAELISKYIWKIPLKPCNHLPKEMSPKTLVYTISFDFASYVPNLCQFPNTSLSTS